MATNPFGPLMAQQVGPMIQQFMRGQNQSRKVPTLPANLAAFSRENTVHIYSVSPWVHTRELGSAGTFTFAKCDPEKAYAGPVSIPGIVVETVPIDEQKFELRQEAGDGIDSGGMYIARQILGEGAHLQPANSFRKYGVFIGKQIGLPGGKIPVPGAEELAAANEALGNHLMELVLDARSAAAKGQKEKEAEIRPAIHHVAARLLASKRFGFQVDLDNEEWIVNSKPSTRIKCGGCGTMADNEVILCAACGYILKPKEYEANKGRFAR